MGSGGRTRPTIIDRGAIDHRYDGDSVQAIVYRSSGGDGRREKGMVGTPPWLGSICFEALTSDQRVLRVPTKYQQTGHFNDRLSSRRALYFALGLNSALFG